MSLAATQIRQAGVERKIGVRLVGGAGSTARQG